MNFNYYKLFLFLLVTGFALTSCKKNEADPITEKQTGFMLFTSTADGTDYIIENLVKVLLI